MQLNKSINGSRFQFVRHTCRHPSKSQALFPGVFRRSPAGRISIFQMQQFCRSEIVEIQSIRGEHGHRSQISYEAAGLGGLFCNAQTERTCPAGHKRYMRRIDPVPLKILLAVRPFASSPSEAYIPQRIPCRAAATTAEATLPPLWLLNSFAKQASSPSGKSFVYSYQQILDRPSHSDNIQHNQSPAIRHNPF